MEIFSLDNTSKNIGYIVPIKTTDKKYTINKLFIIMKNSLDNMFNFKVEFSIFGNFKNKTVKAKIAKINKNVKINIPLSGSLAKV